MNLLIAGLAGAEVEALVGLLEDECVCRLRLAERMAVEPVLALGLFVFDGIEEGGVVVGPDEGADALGGVGEGFAGAQVFDVQRVLAETGVVDRVGEQVLVFGDAEAAERHEGMAFGELVAVEDDLFGSIHRSLAAAVDGVLRAFDGARVVVVAGVAVGVGLVGLLDVAQHLAIEGFLEGLGGGHPGVGVGVFGFEIGGDLLGVFVAQPGVIVVEGMAVERMGKGLAACDGRRG